MRTEAGFDLAPVPDRRMALRIAGQVAAAGAAVGGLEAIGLAWRTRLSLSPGEVVLLGFGSVLADAGLGLGIGLAVGAVTQLATGRMRRWARYRLGFTVSTALLAAFFLVPGGRELWDRDQRGASTGMIVLEAAVIIMCWFNAGYWYRREAIGAAPRLGWRIVAWGAGLGMAVLAAPCRADPPPPPVPPPASAPDLILITLDTLRRDHVGAFGSVVSTPVLDRLAREGAAFTGAITPLPETAPSHASMFTGYPPAWHGVVSNGQALRQGYTTVAEQLHTTGWRTGAFVSSYAVDSATGLDQGFQVYDDDFFPALRGVSEVRAARLGLKAVMRLGDPADWPFLLERPAPDTIARALRWAAQPGPMFLWVHLFEPHSPYEPHDGSPPAVDHRAILAQEPGYPYTEEERAALRGLYRDEVEYTDGQVGALLDGLEAAGKLDNALVIVSADHGESLGEHGIDFNHHGLYDEVLAVPLLVWASNPAFAAGSVVGRQVTVGDIANTLLDFAGVPRLVGTDSLPLTTHLSGTMAGAEVEPRPVLLIGRLVNAMKGGRLLGVRTPVGVKYIQEEGGKELLFDLRDDPAETRDISASEPGAIAAGRENVALLESRMPGELSTEDEQLKALGYKD